MIITAQTVSISDKNRPQGFMDMLIRSMSLTTLVITISKEARHGQDFIQNTMKHLMFTTNTSHRLFITIRVILMRRLTMPMVMSMYQITLRLFIMRQLMMITATVVELLTLVVMVIHQVEVIVILAVLTIQIMYHNLLTILKKHDLWSKRTFLFQIKTR